MVVERGRSGVCRTASEIRSRAARISASKILSRLSFASSVRSVRTGPELGNILCLISPASSSTGVPCVPTTSSPMIARNDFEMSEAPDADSLVPLGQRLRELVEVLMLAAVHV